MIEIKITWHILIMLILQILIVVRVIYIFVTEKKGGMFGGLHSAFAFIFCIIISLLLWLVYGGIYWW